MGLDKAIWYGFNDELDKILDTAGQAATDQADTTIQKAEIAEAIQAQANEKPDNSTPEN
jgi:phytoene/squalene synthetase